MSDYTGKTCPFCKGEIKEGDEVMACPACGIPHHKECWEENKGCTTFGCSEQHYEAQGTNISDVCSKCGAPLGDGQMFCPKCGTSKGAPKANVCGKCGTELAEGQEFCPKCGQKVGLSVDPSVADKINQANTTVVAKKKKKFVVPIAIGIAAIFVVLISVFVNNQMQTKKIADAKDAYITDAKTFASLALTVGANLEDLADTLQTYWYDAIWNDKHYGEIDKAMLDWMVDKSNEIALAETYNAQMKSAYDRIKKVPEGVDDDDIDDICNAAKSLYNSYTDYYSFATDPSGSYSSFSSSNGTKTDDFLSKYRALDNLLD
jgi:ribosomal protein L40E